MPKNKKGPQQLANNKNNPTWDPSFVVHDVGEAELPGFLGRHHLQAAEGTRRQKSGIKWCQIPDIRQQEYFDLAKKGQIYGAAL